MSITQPATLADPSPELRPFERPRSTPRVFIAYAATRPLELRLQQRLQRAVLSVPREVMQPASAGFEALEARVMQHFGDARRAFLVEGAHARSQALREARGMCKPATSRLELQATQALARQLW